MQGRPTLDGIKQASQNAMNKAQLMVGLKEEQDIEAQEEEPEQPTMLSEAADLLCPELTFQQRIIGFASCFTIAYLITFMSFKFFIQLIEGRPVPFAVNYTLGNILALGASWFLCGPKRQFKTMFDEKRRTAAMVYLSCLGGTLAMVFLPIPWWTLRLALMISMIITQCLASFWYSLSYVPYGRRTVTRMTKRYLGLSEQPIEGIVS